MIDSVPLIQNANDAQQINASIIAMKKASRELDEKILKLNNLNSELDKKIALLDSGLTQEIADRQSADNTEVTNRNTAITNAINALDVSSVGGSGKYISAISETDGKISATASDITSTVSSGNSQPVTSSGVASAIIGDTIYNPCYNDYDTTFNIDTVGAGHRTYVASSVGGGTSGNCPSHYGVVHTITANGTAWKFQVAKETYSDTTYTRQNINDGGWTAWQPVLSGTWETLWSSDNSIIKGIVCNGKAFVTIHLQSFVCSSDFHLITTIAEKYRPRTVSRGYCFSAETPIIMGFVNIESNGNIYINTMNGKTVYGDSFIMIEKDV